MTILKYIGIALGGLLLIGILAFAVLMYFMNSASKAGQAKIAALEQEFHEGQSVDGLIKKAEQVDINQLWWKTDAGDEHFEDNFGMATMDPAKFGKEDPNKKIDFKAANEKFKSANTGVIYFLAYGSMPLERFTISFEFRDRKIVKVALRTID